MTKVCSKCKKKKAISKFSKNRNRKDGLGNWCKRCMKIYSKKYRIENREYFKNYHKEYRQKNKEKIREYYRKYYQKHKETKGRKVKKVYCKNCRYLCKTKSYRYLSSREYCNAPEIATHLMGLIISPLVLNNDNKCMYYKRKWWKFWVREKNE